MTAHTSARPSGMFAFTIVWIGQLVSLIGTSMTQFALTIWAYQLTGSAAALALVGFFSFAPVVLFSPIAGVLVDRWNRKLVMMMSDIAAGLSTIIIFLLHLSGNLQIWHLYVAGAFTGIFQSLQFPAYSAAMSLMLKKEQYTRANAMLSFADAASGVIAPVLAGALIALVRISGVLLIDIITFVFAVTALAVVHVPEPQHTEAQKEQIKSERGSFLNQLTFGFRYIIERPSLLGLQIVFFTFNLTGTIGAILLAPMVLARTGNSELILGWVQSAGGIGGVLGSLALSAWGGPKRRVNGVIIGLMLGSIFQILFGLGTIPLVWIISSALLTATIPVANASNQAIWMAKIPPHMQGRVFAVRRTIAQISAPLAMFLAGFLADGIFEPAMREGGSLAGVFGGIFGVGAGAGMALMITLAGIIGASLGVGAYLFPAIRNAEDILPDHEAIAAPAVPEVAAA
jgi:MFS transporter, DHA3 family, macrolide efflux protein